MLRRVVLLLVLPCLPNFAAPKQRSWQDANVARIEHSSSESEEVSYSHTMSDGSAWPSANGIDKRRKQIWTYAFKNDRHIYIATAERKPLQNVSEGDRVGVVAVRTELYVLLPSGKQRRLRLLNADPALIRE